MLEGPYAERVHTRLPAPDPGNTGVGKAFLSLFTTGRRACWQKGCFSWTKSIPFILYKNGKEGTTYMAAHAAEAALENAGIGADELDMIIVATVSADTYVPSTSCSVQGAIGAIRATCFDINAACSGFLFALNTAYAYIEMGMAKTVLVAGAETLSREVDWSDRGSCILFGDGSGAAIVQKDDSNVGGLIASVTGSVMYLRVKVVEFKIHFIILNEKKTISAWMVRQCFGLPLPWCHVV